MNANFNGDCTVLAISFPNPATSSDLQITNCQGEILYEELGVVYPLNDTIFLTPSDLQFTSNTFPFQPYKIRLINYFSESKTQTTYYTCPIPICGRICDIVKKVSLQDNTNALLVAAIEYAAICPTCSCTSICTIWEELNNENDDSECAKCKSCSL